MREVIIKVENLTKTFKLYDHPKDRLKEALNPFRAKYHHDYQALKNISFEIKKGDSVGIIGDNGAGKSTLLKVLTGVLTPSSGKVVVTGRIAALLELGAGFNPDLSGLDNIYFQGAIMGLTREGIKEKIEQIIEFAEIGEFISQPVKTYSSGMFVRLAFSIAVSIEPDILIVDEALAVGDHRFVQKCYKKIDELKNTGTTLLFVTHDVNAVKLHADNAIWLSGGSIVLMGCSAKVVDSYRSWSDNLPVIGEIESKENAKLQILDFSIKNLSNNSSLVFKHGEKAEIFLRIKNQMLACGTRLRFGFSIRNHRSYEICGSNTQDCNFEFATGPQLSTELLYISFEVPLLASGKYSISFNIDSEINSGLYQTDVFVPDGLELEVEETTKVYTLLGLKADYKISR